VSDSSDPGNPQGFNFGIGQLFPLPPPGTLENIPFAGLNLVFDIATGNLLGVIVDIATLLDDLIQGLINLFTGKPRAQDTITVIQRFEHSVNPAGYITGVRLQKLLSDLGIVLSDSRPSSQADIGGIRKAAYQMLEAQGVSTARAEQVIDSVFSNTTSAGQALPAELTQPIPPGYQLVGDTTILSLWANRYNQDIAKGEDPLQAAKDALHYMLEKASADDIRTITIQPIPPGTPPPVTPPPPQPPPVTPPPPEVPSPGDGSDGDDEVSGYLYTIAQSVINLQTLIQNMQSSPGQGNGEPSECCVNIVVAISTVAQSLASIGQIINSVANQGSGGSGSSASVAAELTRLVQLITPLTLLGPPLLAFLQARKDCCPPPDFSAIVEQLKRAADADDSSAGPMADAIKRAQALGQDLVTRGIFSGDLLQPLLSK